MKIIKKSTLSLILSALFLPNFIAAQQITGTEKDEIYFSSSQIAGYSGIGLGAATLIYASRERDAFSPSIDNKAVEYVVGSALVATGIGFLIFGDKSLHQ